MAKLSMVFIIPFLLVTSFYFSGYTSHLPLIQLNQCFCCCSILFFSSVAYWVRFQSSKFKQRVVNVLFYCVRLSFRVIIIFSDYNLILVF